MSETTATEVLTFSFEDTERERSFRKNLLFPAGTDGPAPLVVFGHGFVTKTELYSVYGRELASCGLNVLLVDYPDNFEKAVDIRTVGHDLIAGVDELRSGRDRELDVEIDYDRVVFSGHSKGGAGALQAGLIADRFGLDPLGISALTPPLFVEDRPDYDPSQTELYHLLEVPILLVSGELDEITGYATDVKPIFDQLNAPAALANVKGANHTYFSEWEEPMFSDVDSELDHGRQLEIATSMVCRFTTCLVDPEGDLGHTLNRLAEGLPEVELEVSL